MSRSPRITGSELIAALMKDGFQVVRVRGSHHFLRHEDGRSTVVPVHSGETLAQGPLDSLRLRTVLGIEPTADSSLVEPKAACQFGVGDLLVAHRQIECRFRREPKGHQALTTLRG
jgi:predicted RNA binding protein YcfA (HicA-like mRNA interferase family)